MSSESHEIVVLVLKDVVYRHSEFRSLEEFLVEKYGFNKIEEKEHKISELKKIIPIEEAGVHAVSEEIEKKLSSLKIYEGNYLEAKIKVCILGDVIQKEDIIAGAGEEEKYPVYTAEYQMIKLIGESGYAMQQFIERLAVDLGLKIKSKEWVFHRCREG
ncbi:MAG: hypothetical protein ACP5ER_00020 [Candidatus Bathyarchaeales archaeon]